MDSLPCCWDIMKKYKLFSFFYARCNKYIHDALRLLLVTVSIYHPLVWSRFLAFPAVCFVTSQLSTIASGREGGSYL